MRTIILHSINENTFRKGFFKPGIILYLRFIDALYVTYITDRSGSEEEYSELEQLCEGIITYRRDLAETKEKEKEAKKRRDENDRKKAEEMRQAAVERLAST